MSATNTAGLYTVLAILGWVSLPWTCSPLAVTKSRGVVEAQLLKYEEMYFGSGLVGCLESQAFVCQ
jgi:hypothetical protein